MSSSEQRLLARRRSMSSAGGPVLSRARLAAAAFDVLPGEAVVLDSDGVVLVVNEAWRQFGRANGAGAGCGAGVDYLGVCRRSAAAGDQVAAVVAAALSAVLTGGAPEARVDYPCHAPDEQRWFRLVARPLAGQRRVLVVHDRIAVPIPASEQSPGPW